MPQGDSHVAYEEAAPSDTSFVTPASDLAWPHHGLLLTFTFIWGGNFVLAEVALREMAPISFSVMRFLAGGVALVALLYGQQRFSARKHGNGFSLFPRIAKADWPRLLLIAVLGATLAPWLGIEGLGQTHGARASLWLALGPVLSSAIGFFLRTERIGTFGYVGAFLAGLGTFVLALDGLDPSRNYWVGDLLLFLALLLAVVELHLIKPLAIKYGATSMVAARTMLGGTLFLLIASPALSQEAWSDLTFWVWVAILFGGGVGVGMGQWVKVRALRKLGPTRVVLYGNLVPLAAIWIACVTIGTEPTRFEMLAGALIILGAICLQVVDPARKRLKENTSDEPPVVFGSDG